MPIEPMLTEETPASALVARVLEEAGIEMVFGISGGHTGRIVSGLSKYQNSIRTVLVREESLGGVMAEVYGRLTRRPGVMLGQGPWVLGNGLIGTIEAHLSSSPMLLLTDFSDAPRFPLHAPYQQGTGDWGSWDARRAFGGVTKHVMQAHDPVAAVQATQLGIKHALAGQPGPVAILYSHDSLAGSVMPDSQPMLYPTRYYLPGVAAAGRAAAIEAAAAAILAAHKPVMIAGNGVRIAQAYDQLRQLAETAGLPVATTAAGKGTFAETHPLALGVFGTFGTEAANACIAEADLVVVVGSKLSPSDTAWENRALLDPTRQTFIQIDIEPRNASWNYPAEHVLLGDAAVILGQLAAETAGARVGRRQSAERRVAGHRERHGYFDERAYFADDRPILPQRVIGELQRGLARERDRHLRRRREPHHDDAFLPDQAGRGLSAGGGLGADGLRDPGRARRQARPSRPAGCRGVRRWRLRDDDERADDRGRARHPDHLRWCSTTTRSAGCCTAPGRSRPSSTIGTTPRSPARWAAAASGSRSRQRSRPLLPRR